MQFNLQSSLLTDLQISEKIIFKHPSSWPNIRKNIVNGHIYLLADTRYPIGFAATVTGGYSVNINGQHYADYNNQAQFSMADWSAYTDSEGYDIDYPTDASKAHIIDIYPQISGNNITSFSCKRVAASGEEQQGILWAHFNLSNSISLYRGFGQYNTYKNTVMEAVTAKNNLIKVSALDSCFYGTTNLSYTPVLNCQNIEMSFYGVLWNNKSLKKITLKNAVPTTLQYFAYTASALEEIKGNLDFSKVTSLGNAFVTSQKLKKLPATNFSTPLTNAGNGISYCTALEDTIINLQNCTSLNKWESYRTAGIKGLRVSNQAPFDNATAPQINISYTGMDRQALVTLFNDLPTVTGGQIINIVGCTGTADLTDDDKAIATDKGWTITQ